MEAALLDLCAYTEAWRERLRRAWAMVPPGGWDRPITAGAAPVGHGSLRDTVIHVVMVEEDWMEVDIVGRDVDLEAEIYVPERFPDMDSILDRGQEVRARFREWIPRWQEPVHLPKREFTTTVGDILMHVLLHEVAHHGDLYTILASLDPAASDAAQLYWVRFRMGQAGRS